MVSTDEPRGASMDDLSRADPVMRARNLVLAIAASADEIDRIRRLPESLLAGLHTARLFRMLLPRSVGGDEVEPGVCAARLPNPIRSRTSSLPSRSPAPARTRPCAASRGRSTPSRSRPPIRSVYRASPSGSRTACSTRSSDWPPVPDRARARLAILHAISSAIAVADYTDKAAGVDAIFPKSPFERRFRDIHTLSQQIQSREETAWRAVGGSSAVQRLRFLAA